MAGQTLTIGKALNLGLRRAMEDDAKVVLMGEDIGKLGGVFRITDGLQKDFGEDRVVDTPLAEAGILGTAVGLAMRGYRPVCEIQFDGFVFPAYNQTPTGASSRPSPTPTRSSSSSPSGGTGRRPRSIPMRRRSPCSAPASSGVATTSPCWPTARW